MMAMTDLFPLGLEVKLRGKKNKVPRKKEIFC